MPRWEPDARERLVAAALHLFSEQGYDETTVAGIAAHAGLTKSTFFRHFPDKRDVLAAGQETLSRLFVEGIAAAPADATPLTAVAAGLERAARVMTPFNRQLGPRLRAVIATSAELQERDALKQVGLAAATAGTPHGSQRTTSRNWANWCARPWISCAPRSPNSADHVAGTHAGWPNADRGN